MSRKSERWSRNKRAFNEVIGDPYALHEPIEGHYSMLKGRSTIMIAGGETKSPSPVNQARPNVIDFIIDVDACVEDGMSTMDDVALRIFIDTYITEDPDAVKFDQNQRNKVEQLIGNILVERKIYPVTKYFTTIRK